jgi:hypothetical protein
VIRHGLDARDHKGTAPTVGSNEKSRKIENVEKMVEIGEKIENA